MLQDGSLTKEDVARWKGWKGSDEQAEQLQGHRGQGEAEFYSNMLGSLARQGRTCWEVMVLIRMRN